MPSSTTDLLPPKARRVTVTDEALFVELGDDRTISVPLVWYPRLLHGTPAERARWRLIGDGEGIHWPDLDEDIHTAHLLLGLPSAESPDSLAAWLAGRSKGD